MKKNNTEALKAVCGGKDRPLVINGIKAECYVLTDGRRVISQNGFRALLGMTHKGSNAPVLGNIAAKTNDSRFNSDEKLAEFNAPVSFLSPKGLPALGYDATLLADACELIVKAFIAGKLRKNQHAMAFQCMQVQSAFAKIGLIALIDEATGYQEQRANDELQSILSVYISPEFAPWARMFPKELWEELSRLKGWDFDGVNLNSMPRYAGKFVADYIYARLPKGVKDALDDKNPADENYQRRHRHHQGLTREQGLDHLKALIHSTIALLRAASSWEQFLSLDSANRGGQRSFHLAA